MKATIASIITASTTCAVYCIHKLPDGTEAEEQVGGITGTSTDAVSSSQFMATSASGIVEIAEGAYFTINRIKTPAY